MHTADQQNALGTLVAKLLHVKGHRGLAPPVPRVALAGVLAKRPPHRRRAESQQRVWIGHRVSVIRVAVDVQIGARELQPAFGRRPCGLDHRIGRVDREVNRLATGGFVEHHRDCGKTTHRREPRALERSGDLHGHGVELERVERAPDLVGRLESLVKDRQDVDAVHNCRERFVRGHLLNRANSAGPRRRAPG
jgi:hypothetical protein